MLNDKKTIWTLNVTPGKMPNVVKSLSELKINVVKQHFELDRLEIKVDLNELNSILVIDGVEGASYAKNK